MVVLRCAIVLMVRSHRLPVSFGIVMMFCVVRVPLLMRGYGGVLRNRTGMGGAGSLVTRAIANATHAADSDAHKPKQHARPRENAEQSTDCRLPRNFQLRPVVGWKSVRRYGVFAPYKKTKPGQTARGWRRWPGEFSRFSKYV